MVRDPGPRGDVVSAVLVGAIAGAVRQVRHRRARGRAADGGARLGAVHPRELQARACFARVGGAVRGEHAVRAGRERRVRHHPLRGARRHRDGRRRRAVPAVDVRATVVPRRPPRRDALSVGRMARARARHAVRHDRVRRRRRRARRRAHRVPRARTVRDRAGAAARPRARAEPGAIRRAQHRARRARRSTRGPPEGDRAAQPRAAPADRGALRRHGRRAAYARRDGGPGCARRRPDRPGALSRGAAARRRRHGRGLRGRAARRRAPARAQGDALPGRGRARAPRARGADRRAGHAPERGGDRRRRRRQRGLPVPRARARVRADPRRAPRGRSRSGVDAAGARAGRRRARGAARARYRPPRPQAGQHPARGPPRRGPAREDHRLPGSGASPSTRPTARSRRCSSRRGRRRTARR